MRRPLRLALITLLLAPAQAVLGMIVGPAQPASAATTTFDNPTTITVPGAGDGAVGGSPAAAYPSTINVAGLNTITKVTPVLRGFSHTFPDDLGVLLVSPSGKKILLMADVGSGPGGGSTSDVMNNATLTFDDAGPALPDSTQIVTGTFRPTKGTNAGNLEGETSPTDFPAGAPTSPYSLTLADLIGDSPNGTWSLYVIDDAPGDAGSMAGGWSLIIETADSILTINDVSVDESDSGSVNAVFTVSLNPPSLQTVTVNASTTNGTATAGSDYTATIQTLTFTPGLTTQTFTVPVLGDALPEGDETFTVSLSAPVNGVIGDGSGLGTIRDNDATGLSINDVTVNEGGAGSATTATFTVSLSRASALPVTVVAQTANGSAAAGSDYTATGPTVLTFVPGETSKSFSVAVTGDDTVEPDETFLVNLTNPSNAPISDGQGVGTIRNDDAAAAPSQPTNVSNNSGNGDKKDKDEQDGKAKPSEDSLRHTQHTNQSGRHDHHTDGQIDSWEPGPWENSLLVTIGQGSGGAEKVTVLIVCPGGRCPALQQGWRLEADGEQHGVGDPDNYFVASGDWKIGPP